MPVAAETHPLLYQINTRVLLGSVSASLGRQAGFDDIPDEGLRALAELGFDWVWFLGVWQTGEAGRQVSRTHPSWQAGFREALPDLRREDICGSPFAIAAWQADTRFGGDAALERLRRRVHAAGLRLMLDFVPNHLAPDHPWVHDRPGLFVRGTPTARDAEPEDWFETGTGSGPMILAHGRDPYFPGWPDTAQLDYSNPETQAAMRAVLCQIAARCDGVRCDMAMLLLPEVFERSWRDHLDGRAVASFWPDAIRAARAEHPRCRLMAEVYWNLEAALLAQGFDWAYDKGLYDALRDGDTATVTAMLAAPPETQSRMARFLENHDEPRAAASFELPRHKAAAVLTFCAPGLRLLHQGQLDGARVHIPIHLDRGPVEALDPAIHEFYLDLLAVLREPVLRDGVFLPLEVDAAWEGNPSHAAFAASLWSDADGPGLFSVVNYRADRGQCRIRIRHPSLADRAVVLSDRLGPEHYARDGNMLATEGMYLDLPGWGYNLFAIG